MEGRGWKSSGLLFNRGTQKESRRERRELGRRSVSLPWLEGGGDMGWVKLIYLRNKVPM